MKIAQSLRRIARCLWTRPHDCAPLDSGYRNIEDQVRILSDEEFKRYLKAHSRSYRVCSLFLEYRTEREVHLLVRAEIDTILALPDWRA